MTEKVKKKTSRLCHKYLDRDDEKPTVVVMREGDLTEHEASEEEAGLKLIEDAKKVVEGKISFKKPNKREKEDESKDSDEPKKKKEKSSKNVKQKKSLLSFDDEEEDS